MNFPFLTIKNLKHAYGALPVLKGLNLELLPGQIGCILGPSGCGKSTLLRLIAGFEKPLEGDIYMGEAVLVGQGHALEPQKRGVGLVFQDWSLFGHLRVEGNIAFGLKGRPAFEKAERVDSLIRMLGLENERHRFPHELSGGQQQRVALARALAPRPRLLLLDEPFSSLDQELRERLCQDVRQVLKKEQMTAILVTHLQSDAFSMADVIGVMHQGRIEQWASADEIYHYPRSRFAARFVGEGAFLPGKVISDNQVEMLGRSYASLRGISLARGSSVEVLIRPDDVHLDPQGSHPAEIVSAQFRGAIILYTFRLQNGMTLLGQVPSHERRDIGEQVNLRLEFDYVVCFPAEA